MPKLPLQLRVESYLFNQEACHGPASGTQARRRGGYGGACLGLCAAAPAHGRAAGRPSRRMAACPTCRSTADGDAGTAAAIEAALAEIAEGEGQRVIDLIDNAPPGPIETKWGLGFRNYAECMDYIRANHIEAPEGGVALPLPYTIYERPTYSVVPSNALWRDPARADMAKRLAQERGGQPAAEPLFPAGDARRAADRRVLPRSLAQQPRMHGPARRLAGALRVQVPELLRRGGSGACVLPGDREAPPGLLPGRDRCAGL